MVPLKLKGTKRFKEREVVGMEIGGQMAFVLAVPKEATDPQAQAAKSIPSAKESHGPPEPAPAEASA